jgi:hypothetical protein
MDHQECEIFLPLDDIENITNSNQRTTDPTIDTIIYKKCGKEQRKTKAVANLKAARLEEFDNLLSESIDDALTSLGASVKSTVYLHLQNDFGINKNEIPSKISEFSDIIHKVFGVGATPLEIKFMMNLNSKVKAAISWPKIPEPFCRWFVADMSFTEYVINMRKSYADC